MKNSKNGCFHSKGVRMKIRKNKRGFYERDDREFKDWLLLAVCLGIVLAGFSFRLFTILF